MSFATSTPEGREAIVEMRTGVDKEKRIEPQDKGRTIWFIEKTEMNAKSVTRTERSESHMLNGDLGKLWKVASWIRHLLDF